MSAPSINLAEASRFLDLMAEGEAVTFQTFDDDAGRKSPALANVLHGFLDSHAARLKVFNDRGAGIFWTVNFTDGGGRRAENVTSVRAIFLDLDGAPLQPVLAAGVEPHAVVESSPAKWHCYWLVNGCKLDQFKAVQLALAAKFNGDPSVNDLPRVMRLPGFIHRKGEPFATRVESMTPMQPYEFADLVQRLGLDLTAQAARRVQHVDPDTGEIHDKVQTGGRHLHLVKWAAQLNWRGMPAEAVRVALLAENQRTCEPPMAEAEVEGIVADILRRYQPQHGRDRAARATYRPAPDSDEDDVAPAWPEPLLPGTSRVPEIDPALLGGWLGDMAATVAVSTQTPPAMAVIVALAIVATVVHRRFEVAPHGDDYREPLCIFGVAVLGPGNRKSAVFKFFQQVIVDIEKREGDRRRREIARVNAERDVIAKRMEVLKLAAGKEDDAVLRQRLQDQIAELRDNMPDELFPTRLFTGDATPERMQMMLVEQFERIAVLSAEGGIFSTMGGAYSGGHGNFDILLHGHAGETVRVDRAGRLAHIDRATITMGLAVQPDIIAEIGKNKRFRGSGLLARCLYVVPRSTVGSRDVRSRIPIDDDVRRRYEGGIDALYAGTERRFGSPRVLPFSAAARECWLALCEDIERRQGEGGRYAHMADWTSKLPGAAARIAALLALAEHGTELESVPEDAVRRAVQIARLLVPHAEAAFALMGASDGEADAQAVLAFVQRHQLLTVARRDLQKSMEGRFRQLDRLLVAIKLLQDWHVLGAERKTAGHGRPSIYYEVNPLLFVDKSIQSPKAN